MYKYILLLGLFVVGSCGDSPKKNCTVIDNNNGTHTISCPDQTSATISDGTDSIDEIIYTSNTLLDLYRTSILDIRCISPNRHIAGTGTKTTNGKVITAHHLVDPPCQQIQYISNGVLVGTGGIPEQFGERDTIEISNINWTTKGSKLRGVSAVINVKVKVGELLYALNHPKNMRQDLQVSVGRVVSNSVSRSLGVRDLYWNGAFSSDYAAAGGSSGAPVFNRNGHWIAIHVGGYSNGGLELNITLPIQPEQGNLQYVYPNSSEFVYPAL